MVDLAAIASWVDGYDPAHGELELIHDRAWATVVRVPLAGGNAWFKACPPLWGFEPRLTVALYDRWPDRVGRVLQHDLARGWLVLADAGTPVGVFGSPPEGWLAILPRYAELQRGEAARASEHLAAGVPDLRLATLPVRFEAFSREPLPIAPDEVARLRAFAPRFAELCDELAAFGVPETIQHDDLHHKNVFVHDGHHRILDWGDTVIGHPFASLVVTFRFLEQRTGLAPHDPWFARLRDAYLEPWGSGLVDAASLALRVGGFARAFAYVHARAVLPPAAHTMLDDDFALVLRRALAQSV